MFWRWYFLCENNFTLSATIKQIEICENESYILSQKDSEILSSLPANSLVSYFSTSQDAVLNQNELNKWNILLAIPCYDRLISEPTMMSVIKTIMYFRKYNDNFSVFKYLNYLLALKTLCFLLNLKI